MLHRNSNIEINGIPRRANCVKYSFTAGRRGGRVWFWFFSAHASFNLRECVQDVLYWEFFLKIFSYLLTCNHDITFKNVLDKLIQNMKICRGHFVSLIFRTIFKKVTLKAVFLAYGGILWKILAISKKCKSFNKITQLFRDVVLFEK